MTNTTKTPVRKPRGAAKKAAAAKARPAAKNLVTAGDVEKNGKVYRAVKFPKGVKPEFTMTDDGAKVGDIVTLKDSGAKRWTIVKITARTLWVDAVRGDDQYTIPHNLVSKIVKSA